ncbi:MAG: iron-containing alcohol dehydrogenase [Chloroflexota bacterium]|nr:iron-containing alcohol dehydrogenase [Chloroflexota bacterium]
MAGAFRYLNPATISWGPGSVQRLGDELERLGIRRPFVVTTRSVARNEALVQRVAGAAGREPLEPYALVGQHAPARDVAAACAEARRTGADGVISLGGGSPIDAAKVVALEAGGLPHVAVPTTLSAAELGPTAGVTEEDGQKRGRRDASLLPSSVIYDGQLALHTPMELWLSTGMRALDHAVESILAEGEHPFSDTMSLEAIRRLFASLPAAHEQPQDAAIRTENQLGAWFSFTLPGPAATGLSHMLGKQIGAPYGIPHGVTSCLLLPHVMRYAARAKARRLAFMAAAMSIDPAVRSDEELACAAAEAVEALVRRLGLPQHLSAYQLTEDQLRAAAQPLVSPGRSLEDLMGIYRAAE